MTTLKIKLINTELIDHYTSFSNFHKGDSGIDLINSDITQINKHQYKIDFQIQAEMLDNDHNISYLLVPRNSIVKTPFRMSNSIGIIDAGYRGNLIAFVDNFYNFKPPDINDKLFQIVRADLKPIDNILIVDTLSDTSRGTGGFGSTN